MSREKELPKLTSITETKKSLREIVEEAVQLIPFDQSYEFPDIQTAEDFMTLELKNNKGMVVQVAPYLASFFMKLNKPV